MFETCKHGVPTCPKGNVLCGEICMNPLDRICVNGKLEECPIKSIVNLIKKNTCTPCPPNEFSVRSQNICTTCPANNIIVNNTCTACPSGEMTVNAPVEDVYSYGYCCNTLAAGAQSCCKTEGIFYKNQCYGRECYNRCAAALNYYNYCLYVKCPDYERDSFNCTLKCYSLYMSATWAAERWIPKCECMPNTRNKLPIYGSISSIEAELTRKKNDAESKKK
jgi:hypothetical protein